MAPPAAALHPFCVACAFETSCQLELCPLLLLLLLVVSEASELPCGQRLSDSVYMLKERLLLLSTGSAAAPCLGAAAAATA